MIPMGLSRRSSSPDLRKRADRGLEAAFLMRKAEENGRKTVSSAGMAGLACARGRHCAARCRKLAKHSERRSMLNEFKEFALKGNVVDLAIGVIIGAAFGRIVESLVGDIIMPLIGAIGSVDFSNYFFGLNSGVTSPVLADAKKQGAVLAYGNFLTVAVNFMIIAFVLFLVVKGINTLRRKQAAKPAEPVAPPQDIALLSEIRDLLKQKQA
jgi:large conductance mechanosensitive channel